MWETACVIPCTTSLRGLAIITIAVEVNNSFVCIHASPRVAFQNSETDTSKYHAKGPYCNNLASDVIAEVHSDVGGLISTQADIHKL